VLRRFRDADREPFAALNADLEVMRHFPAALDREQSDALIDRIEAHFDEHGFGLWAVELADTGALAGFVGLAIPRFEAAFTPCVEVGWRLAREHWGAGIAPEAAERALRFGFGEAGLDEIVSFTSQANAPSRRVMEKLGMQHDPADDFEHPSVAEGSHLRCHVLYRLSRAQWKAGQ